MVAKNMGLVAQELIGDTGQLSIRRVLPQCAATKTIAVLSI